MKTPTLVHAEDHDLGLAHDLPAIARQLHGRRNVLRMFGLAGAGLAASACGAGASGDQSTGTGGSSGSGSSTGTGSSSSGTCVALPQETQGPYPADGSNSSNGVLRNVLTTSGVVRSDIRSSFGGVSTNVAGGVPMTLAIQLTNTNNSCAPLAGYAIYLWHCTREGQYTLYDLPNENFLRGVLVTDSNGLATFTTIFPGCYAGRWPHIHFEVYPSLPVATSYVNRILTSQFALPANACSAVYNGALGYSSSVTNFARVSLTTDNVFADNTSAQLAAMQPSFSGDITSGLASTVTVGLAA